MIDDERPITECPAYSIRRDGTVISRKRWQPYPLATFFSADGHLKVILQLEGGGRISRRVARLVLDAFAPSPGPDHRIAYLDGDPRNCRLDNLEWRHRSLFPRPPRKNIRRGEDMHAAKLTNAQAREIYARANAGERGIDLAREFDISSARISDIKNGRSWTHATQQNGEGQP